MKLEEPIFARMCHVVFEINCFTTVSDFVDMVPGHLRNLFQKALSVNMERTGGLAVALIAFENEEPDP